MLRFRRTLAHPNRALVVAFAAALSFLIAGERSYADAPVPPPGASEAECPFGDSDGDGLCDALERETGTKPLQADSDRDGVPDGVEDVNRDGVVDQGESDPREPGLFPGGYPHIPEPMVFDLVRGLGAKAGEAEVNALAVMTLENGRSHLLWAPEVEWAFADNFAFEVELPMEERELHALKSAFQATLPPYDKKVTHGIQVIGEYLLSSRETEGVVLYIAGARIKRWSFLTMAGTRASTPLNDRTHFDAILNPSVFADLTEAVTVGSESNIEINGSGRTQVDWIPQVHWQLSRRVRVQGGGGVSFQADQVFPLFATRLILE